MASNIQFKATDRPPVAKHDSAVLDLAFVMDCTGSMGSYIHQAQQNIRRIVEQIVAKEVSDIHLALIEYRDHPPQDRSFVTRVHEFTASVKTMKGWLDRASASGGGDGPEAVADAWHALLKLNWRPEATKICVHIADAPPHGLGLSGDGFPNGCPDDLDPVATMHQLAGKGVTLYMVGCEPSINASKPFYMAMAHLTGGQYVPLRNAALLTQVIIGGAEEELSLEALMGEVEEDLRQERAQQGRNFDEVAFGRIVQDKLNSKGIQTQQLCQNGEALPEVPVYAQQMSKHTNMAQMRDAMKSVPVEHSTMPFSFGAAPTAMMPPSFSFDTLGGAPAVKAFKFGEAGARLPQAGQPRFHFGAPRPRPPGPPMFGAAPVQAQQVAGAGPVQAAPQMLGAAPVQSAPQMFSFGAGPIQAAPQMLGAVPVQAAPPLSGDSYSVQTAPVNQMQAQRLVQKAMNRADMK